MRRWLTSKKLLVRCKMSKKKLDEYSGASIGGSDGCFSPEDLTRDAYMAQNNAPQHNQDEIPRMVNTKMSKDHNGCPCFDIENELEFHSFSSGMKKFHLWRQHTKSEEIRQYSKENPNKDFYIHHGGNYMLVKRSKK